MKKSLLLLAALFVSSMGFAQSFTATWSKPTVKNFVDMADDGATAQYLWNVGAQGFFAGHNNYNTRASVALFGDSIRMKALEGTWNFGCYPAQYTNKNKWLYVSCNAWNAMWVDAGNNVGNGSYPGTDQWVVAKQENGSYKITNTTAVAEPGTFGVAEKCEGESPNTRCYIYDPTKTYIPVVNDEEMPEEPAFSGEFWDEWKFVSVDEYVNVYFPEAKRYDAAANLKKQIEGAMEKGIAAADLADQFAVYNNINSTAEELKAAADAAYDKGRWVEIKEYFEDITPGEQNDVSGVFTNSDFSDGNVNGWDITYKGNTDEATNVGYQGAEYKNGDIVISKFIEAWKNDAAPKYLGDGSITQTVPGLPAGKYMLAVDVIANNQGRISDSNNPDGRPDDVQLFAKASLDGKEYFTQLHTKNGVPEHFDFTFIHTGGSMTLGLRVVNSAEAKMPANWIAMDNLKLYYYGEVADDPDKILLDTYLEEVLAKHPIDELVDVLATASYKDAYEVAVEDAQTATEDYLDKKTALEKAVADLEEAISAYEGFAVQVEKWDAALEKYGDQFADSEVWGEFVDFLDGGEVEGYPAFSPGSVLDEMAQTPAELKEYVPQVNALLKKAVAKSLTPGVDCTLLMDNASFADGFTGWVNESGGGTLGGLKAYPCVERYEGKVEVYQILTDVPDGVYELTCQAFERPAGNDKNTIDMESKVVLYMNEWQTPVQNILADAIPEAEAVDYENCFITGGDPTEDYYDTGGTKNKDYLSAYGYIPDGMSGSSYAFRAGRYQQSAKGLVQGGTMKIGLTSNGLNAHWALWAEFKLVYIGSGIDATKDMLDGNIENLTTYLETNSEDKMTAVVVAEIEKVIEDATTVSNGSDNEAMIAAAEKVKAALETAKANVAAMNEFIAASEALFEALESEEANPEAITAYDEIKDEIDGGYQDMDTEALLALVEKVKKLTALANTPDFSGASDANPVDFSKLIVNNGFETGDLSGWANSGTIDGQAQNNTSFDNKQGTYYAEKWHVNGTVDINQTVANLPAGTYDITAYVYSSATDCVLYANDDAVAVTTSGLYTVTVKLEEGADLKFGVSWSDSGDKWTCLDEFKLAYYGTESSLVPSGVDAIEGDNVVTPVAIYTISGVKVDAMQKGLNIVKFSDGSTKKILK